MLSPLSGTPRFSNEETMLYLKKNIAATELQGKGIKIATVLEIIAEQADTSKIETIVKISKLLQEKEQARAQLTQRIQSLSIEILAAYPMICDKLYTEMKDQKQAILSQKKRREQAENIMLKESGDLGNVKSRRISKSQLDLAEAVSHVSLKTDQLQESINKFEDRKQEDLKQCLQEFVWSEMNFHAKSLELLTQAQYEIDKLD